MKGGKECVCVQMTVGEFREWKRGGVPLFFRKSVLSLGKLVLKAAWWVVAVVKAIFIFPLSPSSILSFKKASPKNDYTLPKKNLTGT